MDQLGPDPMKVLERDLGLWALKFLVLGLAITPLRRLTGINLLRYRRAVGLLAFIYASLHLTTYLVLDQHLDFAAIWADIVKRPYITIGMAAFLVLIPLAVTSNNAMVRRLGGPAWQKLHRWVYLAAAAGVVHYILVAKVWEKQSAGVCGPGSPSARLSGGDPPPAPGCTQPSPHGRGHRAPASGHARSAGRLRRPLAPRGADAVSAEARSPPPARRGC